MKIHPLNYESYAIDYVEGQMDPAEKAAFEAFLDEHPAIKKEISELKLFYASPQENIAYPDKKQLLRTKPERAALFRLPSWAVAACWAVVVASMVFWFRETSLTTTQEYAFENVTLESPEDIEGEITIVQVDVRDKRAANQQVEAASKTETQTTVEKTFPFDEPQSFPQNEPETTLAVSEQPAIENETPLDKLPATIELNEMEIYAQSPEVIYYKPLRNIQFTEEFIDTTVQKNDVHKFAVMTPLQKVMKPETYQRINDFNLMNDVINEIDGREVANAFTPEFLKNNLK